MRNLKHIFAQELFIGFVSKVNAEGVNIHVPSSERISKFLHVGNEFHGGLINTYMVIEGEECGFIGRVISTEIPEKERLEISEKAITTRSLHPLIKLEIQTLFDYYDFKFMKSISDFPNVGAKVYHARKEVIDAFVKQLDVSYDEGRKRTHEFATLLNDDAVGIDVSLQSLFSRHFAIVGTTGGGKSWTTAKLVENIVLGQRKVVLLDATGEYKPLVDHYLQKGMAISTSLCNTHVIPYQSLTLEDLFFLTEPSEKSQKPKMFDAIRTLKLLNEKEVEIRSGTEGFVEESNGVKTLRKEGKIRQRLLSLYTDNYALINSNNLNFDIKSLPLQIEKECIWETGRSDDIYGGKDATSLGYCISLIGRINNLLRTERYNKVFNFNSENTNSSLLNAIDDFVDGDLNLLSVDLSYLPYQYNIREIVVNIIGDKLLNMSRGNKFRDVPLVVVLDEAHQFLNKSLNSDYDTFSLDAFDNIAKEGRKYGLFLGITTQIPRDIPIGTLSQIGTFIVHRLINYRDKEIITNTISSANREILSYLPDLGAGEAVLSSIELKMPLLIKVNPPEIAPKSETPQF